jgi:hypothetical protein
MMKIGISFSKVGDSLVSKISVFRIFIIAGLIVSGALELLSVQAFSTPVEQIGAGAAAGILAAIAVKAVHLI